MKKLSGDDLLNSVELASLVAINAHKGQTRKGSSIPYILHPMEAAAISNSILSQRGELHKDFIIASSLLHDVIEDTHLTADDLLNQFDTRTVYLVEVQSENKENSWKQRKQATIDLLKTTQDIDVKIVHLADKLSNMRAIARDYKLLGNKLWDRFNETSIEEQKWYYKSIGENMSELEETRELEEYRRLVEEVFGK